MTDLRLFDVDDPAPTPDAVPGLEHLGPVRYQPIVRVEQRCGWCGTQWSFWWGDHRGHSICGECAGLTYEQIWGDRPQPSRSEP